jgi:hypothetical protein
VFRFGSCFEATGVIPYFIAQGFVSSSVHTERQVTLASHRRLPEMGGVKFDAARAGSSAVLVEHGGQRVGQ